MKSQLSAPYISSLCMELNMIMQSGIPLSEGILMLSEDEDDSYCKGLLRSIYESTSIGDTLHSAMREAGGFPQYVTDMIEVGEKTGRLEAVFLALSQYYDRQEQISKSIKNAIMYPAILLVMMFIVIVILISKVLPIFNDVFNQLGSQMSGAAMAMMNIGLALSNNSVVILIVLAVIVIGAFVAFKVPSSRAALMGFWRSLTANRKLSREIASARFASAMSMSMASGLDVDESLAMAARLTDNTFMSKKIEKCRALMVEGLSFAEAISQAQVFSGLYSRMLAVGFKTGASDSVMEEIAARSEAAVSDDIESLIGKVEPTLVIIMSLIVGLILLSVMLPLMSIMSSIG